MILQSLYELYDRLKDDEEYGIPRPGYSTQRIAFKVVIRPDGSLFKIEDIRVGEGARRVPVKLVVPGSAKPSGSGLNPCFLWDNAAYMLGFVPDDGKPGLEKRRRRAKKAVEAFRAKHLALEAEVGDEAFSAVCRFLESGIPEDSDSTEGLAEAATGFGVFQILGRAAYVHDETRIKAWWDRKHESSATGLLKECLVSGKEAVIAPTHFKIKGVLGAQSSGASIVSFNETAYESYGKHQSFNAPVSKEAVFRYTTALNSMLDGPKRGKHTIRLGDSTVVFWTGRPSITEDVFAQFISNGSAEDQNDGGQDEFVRKKLEVFLKTLRQGRETGERISEQSGPNPFRILALAPNAARLSVRFFYSGTTQELLNNLRQHFIDIKIDPQPASARRKADPEFPPAWMLLRQTARDSKVIPSILGGPLLRSIIAGAQYPAGLFSAVIRRIHADREINYLRACVIKGYLVRNLKQGVSMSLDLNRLDPAYRLGRLFAVLEKTQADALGSVNASIRDRFYSSASATPRSVFPRLLRTYQHHLGKLGGGLKVNREKLVQEILSPLQDFPAHMNLADQGIFAIGYYHQNRDLYTKKDVQETDDNERIAE